MVFFTSEYEYKLDAKGRFVLPSKIKTNLPETSTGELIVRKGFESNLILYPMVEYKKIHHKVSMLNEFDPAKRMFKRTFFRSITQVDLDGAGRILLPKQMLVHAQIEKEMLLVGIGNCVEIWNPKLFEHHVISDDGEYSASAQKILNDRMNNDE